MLALRLLFPDFGKVRNFGKMRSTKSLLLNERLFSSSVVVIIKIENNYRKIFVVRFWLLLNELCAVDPAIS